MFGINSNETRRAPFINQSEPTIQSSFFDEETYPEDEFADFPPPPDFLQTDKEFSPSTERKNSIAQIGVPSIGPNFLAEKLRTVFISIPRFQISDLTVTLVFGTFKVRQLFSQNMVQLLRRLWVSLKTLKVGQLSMKEWN